MIKAPYEMNKEEIFKKYQTNSNGLTNAEARNRLLTNGLNEIISQKPKTKWSIFISQFKDFMLIILIIAALVTAVLAFVTQTYSDLIDVGVILAIVIINAIIGFLQENSANNAIESLKKMTQPTAKVIRDGKLIEISSKEVVAGDILYVETGNVACADCYIIDCDGLKCNESSLTGESLDVEKTAATPQPFKTPLAERKNMVFSGTIISYGHAYCVVVATGMDTEIGKIAKSIHNQKEEPVHIQKKLSYLSKILTIIILFISVTMFTMNLIVPNNHTIIDSLLIAIALAVAAIPESLPAVITIIMTQSVKRLSKKRAIVKKMATIETLGACQVICTDKTGTITQNQMTLAEVFTNNKTLSKLNLKYASKKLLLAMLLCNDCLISEEKLVGDSVDSCMVKSVEKLGYDFAKSLIELPKKHEFPFDSKRNLLTTYHEIDGKTLGFSRGIPDTVLAHCSYLEVNGKIEPMTDERRAHIVKVLDDMCERGMRTIAFCYHEHTDKTYSTKEEDNQIFLGITALRDPPRSTSAPAVMECLGAGIKVIMISGDYPITAKAIAREVGIFKEGDRVLTGAEMDELSDEEFKKILPSVSVYARVSPENKLRIVSSWQDSGITVAMTGDGVNDAPSIKKADIGVGMGQGGTEVAKEAADIVLTDDNFATIVSAVSEGRRIYDNIKKVVQFLLGTNFVEVLSIILITFIHPQLGFLSAIQILLINLITDSIPALSLCVEPPEPNHMKRQPNRPDESIFHGIKLPMLVQVVWQTVAVITSFMIIYNVTNDNSLATTFAFAVLSLSQMCHLVNVRSKRSIFASSPFYNKLFWLAILGSLVIVLGLINIAPIALVFGFTPLSFTQWLMVAALSLSIIPVMEVYKLIAKMIKK